jgi:hypothetical protein
VANIVLKEPIIFSAGTGFIINFSGTELFAREGRTVTFAIGQAVSTTSDVKFNKLTTNPVIIDNGTLRLDNNMISGSFTQTGNFKASSNFTHNGDLSVSGKLTAEKIESELTQSATIYESGSSLFGDTTDDTHHFTGSLFSTGSLTLNASDGIKEISNDTSLTDESSTAFVTENAVKNYIDDNTNNFQSYSRKSFAHTGSFVSVSTASFTTVTASAPTGHTDTTVNDFMFFLNGMIMENDSLGIEQSGSTFLLKVNNNTVGYNLEGVDEIVGFGKFNS